MRAGLASKSEGGRGSEGACAAFERGVSMPVIFEERITRAEIRKHPERIYVFGDNLEKRGFGGLARECRGEPNAIGIPTKKAPSMAESAFFSDADYGLWLKATKPAWQRIKQAIFEGKTVVFPKAGLGTGLAQLLGRAPRIKRAIDVLVLSIQGLDREVQRKTLGCGKPVGRR